MTTWAILVVTDAPEQQAANDCTTNLPAPLCPRLESVKIDPANRIQLAETFVQINNRHSIGHVDIGKKQKSANA
jgi:hypothetical protein